MTKPVLFCAVPHTPSVPACEGANDPPSRSALSEPARVVVWVYLPRRRIALCGSVLAPPRARLHQQYVRTRRGIRRPGAQYRWPGDAGGERRRGGAVCGAAVSFVSPVRHVRRPTQAAQTNIKHWPGAGQSAVC